MARVDLTPAKVHKCKKCGQSFAWQTSQSGKYYQVNVQWDENIPFCERSDFHSKTCGAVEDEVSSKPDSILDLSAFDQPAKVEDVTLDIQKIEDFANSGTENKEVSVPFAENDDLQKINLDIALIEQKVAKISSSLQPLNDAIKQVDVDQAAIMEAVRLAVEELGKQKYSLQQELSSFNSELNELSNRLNALNMEKNKHLAAIGAKQKLIDLAKSVQEIWSALPWYEAMKDYQNEDILFILNAWTEGKTGVLNANDTGLGKTFETGAALDLLDALFQKKHGRAPRVLWLTAKSLVGQSYRENIKWNIGRRQIVVGMKQLVEGKLYTSIIMGADKSMRDFQVDMALEHNAWVLTNYDALNTTPRLLTVEWDIVVCDEVSKLKGGSNCTNAYCKHDSKATACRATGLWRKLRQIIHESPNGVQPFYIPLSATPIENKAREIWAVWHLFDPYHFPSVARFEREYCWEEWINGKKVQRCDTERLIKVMKDQVIRRTKDEVGLNLPDKIVEYDVDSRFADEDEIYRMIRDQMFVKLEAMGDKPLTISALIAQFTYLRQANIWTGGVNYRYEDLDGTVTEMKLPDTESSKLTRAMEKIENLLLEGEQVVVYSTFTEPLKHIVDLINEKGYAFNGNGKVAEARLYTGDENAKGLTDSLTAGFQQGEFQVLCASVKASGHGLNLQKSDQWPGGASNAIILDCWWNPAVMTQVEDRLHRTGQKDTVFIHYMTNEESIDAFMAQILAEKQAMMDGIMEREEIRPAFEWAEILKGLI